MKKIKIFSALIFVSLLWFALENYNEKAPVSGSKTGIVSNLLGNTPEENSYRGGDMIIPLGDNKTVKNPALVNEYNQKQNDEDLLFLENKGQIFDNEGKPRPDILYVAKSVGTNVYLTSSAIHYQFSDTKSNTHRFSMQLENANPSPSVETATPEDYTENYYNEHFPDGLLGVRSFKEITVKDIYPGIDWVIYSKGNFMEYDFFVHPGADPKQIRFRINDADKVSMVSNGDLKMETTLGEVLKHAPVSYMGDELIASRLEKFKDGSFGFDVAAPKDKILRIDPYVEWGTYYGGTGTEVGNSVALDSAGNVYLAGKTNSSTTIHTSGAHDTSLQGNGGDDKVADAFLVKFDANGTRLWGTYYGGGGIDIATNVAVSSTGYVYITGTTTYNSTVIASGGVPETIPPSSSLKHIRAMVRNNMPSDMASAYIVKFNGNGKREWSTYLHAKGGGSPATGKGNSSEGVAVGVSPDGTRVYVLTNIYTDFSTTKIAYDIVNKVLAFVPMSTWLSYAITIADMVVEAAGLLPDDATSVSQLFVLNAANGGYLGGRVITSENASNNMFVGTALAVSEVFPGFHNVYIAGYTSDNKLQENLGGHDYSYTANPGTNTQNGKSQAVIVKYDQTQVLIPSLSEAHRYYGGPESEIPRSIAIDYPYVYIVGTTKSSSGLTTNAFNATYSGNGDGFLAKINMNDGKAEWATYYGGTGEDIINDVKVAEDGNVYVVGTTRSTSGISHNGYMNNFGGVVNDQDGFLVKFSSGGNRIWGTYVGGPGIDKANALAIRTNNKIYVAGTTFSNRGIGKGKGYKTTYGSDAQQAFLIKYAIPSPTNGILYVKKNGTGDKTGRDWNNAIGELADALQATKSNSSIQQIWVAGGEYKPLHRADGIISSPDDRHNSFYLTNNVKIYGGFAGTESSIAERNFRNTGNKSVLSGDIGNSDADNDNVYHVVLAVGNVGTAELNGFTIIGGNATGSSSITVNGESISPNFGGAIRLYNASPVLANLSIKRNYGTNGAGIANYNSSPNITNLLFTDNVATGVGGAIHNENSSPVFTNVTIVGNTATSGSGAMRNFNSAPIIRNSIVLGGISNNADDNTVRINSIVEGYADTSNGNLNGSTDPSFVNVSDGNYWLKDDSPAREKGNNTYFPGAATAVDLAGNPRLSGITIDMGAYEGLPANVYIPDVNFKAYLLARTDINTDNNGEISYLEAEAYTGAINVYNKNISTLTGIEAFINITQLDCSNNNLTSLDVSQNTKLTELRCYNNQLTSLDVSENTALTVLHCYQNQLESLDVTQNTALTDLSCRNNQLETLDVTQNTALTELDCSNNQLESLDLSQNTTLISLSCYENLLTSLDITKNTALRSLNCFQNQLASLDVSKNTALQYLDCYNNQLTALDVSKNTALQYLYCDNNQLTSLNLKNGNNSAMATMDTSFNPNLICIQVDNVADADSYTVANKWQKDATASYNTYCEPAVYIPDSNFKAYLLARTDINTNGDTEIWISEASNFTGTIDCSNLSIADLTGIEAFVNITQLNCSGNLLRTLDITQNTALTVLNCGYNELEVLDVSQNTLLTDLSCYGNQLETLDVTQNTVLTKLNCSNNELTNLNVSQNTALKDLQCYNNQLISLNLSSNTALEKLDCSNNELFGISFTQNVALTHLYCNNNQLIGLNVSRNTALVEMDCSNNAISSIDITKNTVLTHLYCNNNELGNLDLSKNTVLEELDCSNNELENLDITKNTVLTGLYCDNNLLTSLDVTKNTVLVQLDCSNNEITGLDITKNIVLEDLSCSENKIPSLDTSLNIALVTLYCDNNLLTSLDVSQNPALETLWCSQNQLTTLNAKNGQNSNLALFFADDNENLSCIQVDNPAENYNGWKKDEAANYSTDCSGTLSTTDINKKEVVLYPNPVKEVLYFSEEVSNIRIMDLSGRTVKQVFASAKSVNVSSLANGVYVISANTKAGKVITRKIVKE